MTQLMVSKRDGIVRAPDGTQYRVARGKTLADARHAVVVAYPNDWSPMEVALPVDDADAAPVADEAALDELREQLTEAEESAEFYAAELNRLREGLAAVGLTLPAEDERTEGWLVTLALETVEVGINALKANLSAPEAEPVPAPRTPRAAKPKPLTRG